MKGMKEGMKVDRAIMMIILAGIVAMFFK